MAATSRLTFQPYGATPPVTIEVNAVSFDAVQTLNIGSASTGAGAGKVAFNPLRFTKKPDIHSADLWLRLCSGTPFLKVTFEVANVGSASPYFSFTMGLVAVKTIAFAVADGESGPLEVITMDYGQAAYAVSPQNPDGSYGKPVAAGWDRVRNIQADPAKVGIS